jgi:hypothetical protein
LVPLSGAGQLQTWLFGNLLRLAGSAEVERLEISGSHLVTPVLETKPGIATGIDLVVAETGAPQSTRRLHEYLFNLLQQAQQRQGWAEILSSTAELGQKETQLELRRVAREIDTALISIELMRAFPGRCSLCPV